MRVLDPFRSAVSWYMYRLRPLIDGKAYMPMRHKATRFHQFLHHVYRHPTRLYKRSTGQSQAHKQTLKKACTYASGNQTHDPITGVLISP